MQTRRSILTIMGLGSVAAATVASEQLSNADVAHGGGSAPGLVLPGPESQEQAAKALENLAKAIRSGDATFIGMHIHSDVKFTEWLTHSVTINVEVPIEGIKVG